MVLLEELLERLAGKLHFYVTIDNHPAAEIVIHEKAILIDVKNPVLAMEALMGEFLKQKKAGRNDVFRSLKGLGYTVKVKYKIFEMEL